ncbi:MAG: RDD family protein [Fimbriimonadaceae bacterium]|nr:RDD family protein [Fimbriimonadaceae bacterium]
MAQEVALLSPEKTIVTYRLAGIGSRALANILDVIIVWVTLTVLVSIIALAGGLMGVFASSIFEAIFMILAFAGPLLYFILFEGLWNGQTIGKKAAGIRVRMVDGTAVRFGSAVGRNLMRAADFLPFGYFAGVIAMFTNPRSQRIGDLISGTIVVYERTAPVRFTVAPHAVATHPLENSVGELKGMTMEEYLALRRFCDRFPELSTNIQNKMIEEVWKPIARTRGIPELANVHPIYVAEAAVMRYGRTHGLL